MKKLRDIVLSSWIHLPGFYITAYISGILFKLVGLDSTDSWLDILLENPFSILLSFIIYGSPIIIGFYILLTILDIFLFSSCKRSVVKWIIATEWIAISSPFIYWAIKYEFWIWVSLSASFLVTQLMRVSKIERTLQLSK